MFIFRIGLSYVTGVAMGLGAIGVWIAMIIDWIVRISFCYTVFQWKVENILSWGIKGIKEKYEFKTKGILCIVTAAFCFAFMSLCVRLAGDLPSMQKILFRNLLAFYCRRRFGPQAGKAGNTQGDLKFCSCVLSVERLVLYAILCH